MPYLRHALSKRLTRRTCLCCGFQGQQLQGPNGLKTLLCPQCGADLCARPPRSYAEMEGMVDVGLDPDEPTMDTAPGHIKAGFSCSVDAQPRSADTSAPRRWVSWAHQLDPVTGAVLFLSGALAFAAAVSFLF